MGIQVDNAIMNENYLLRALSEGLREDLSQHLELVELGLRESLYEADKAIPYVYFFVSGVASMLTPMEDGTIVEVGTIGREGLVGIPVFLGAETSPGPAFCQIPGQALRMNSHAFRDEVELGGALTRVIN